MIFLVHLDVDVAGDRDGERNHVVHEAVEEKRGDDLRGRNVFVHFEEDGFEDAEARGDVSENAGDSGNQNGEENLIVVNQYTLIEQENVNDAGDESPLKAGEHELKNGLMYGWEEEMVFLDIESESLDTQTKVDSDAEEEEEAHGLDAELRNRNEVHDVGRPEDKNEGEEKDIA